MSHIMSCICYNLAIRKGRVIADDKRWMIRGVDREIRKAVKDAARTEGVSVGTWVRRCLVRAIKAAADAPTTMSDLSKHVRILDARLGVLEKSHRDLHHELHATDGLAAGGVGGQRTRWRRTRKSKSSS